MIFDKEAFEAEHAGKRGVRPNQHYLEIALDNLENLYIGYYTHTKKEKNTDADKKEWLNADADTKKELKAEADKRRKER